MAAEGGERLGGELGLRREQLVVFKEEEEGCSRPSHRGTFDVAAMDGLPYRRKEEGTMLG